MASTGSRIWRALRSRRLAIGLIFGVVAFSTIATLVPQSVQDPAKVLAWAEAHPTLERIVAPLGMHAAFSTPAFLLLAGLLTLSTAACAAERTGRARRQSTGGGPLSSADADRLRNRPQTSHALSVDMGSEEALTVVARALGRAGLRVRTGSNIIEGVAGGWGRWGSPAFHWALVLLALTAALGQATRAEGSVGLRVGATTRDAPAGYLSIVKGPLFGERFTGVDLRADDLVPDLLVGGISRGPAPTITVLRNGAPVVTQRVYPNSPLRYGPLLIHMADTGLAAVFSVETSSGFQINSLPFMLRYPSDDSSSTIASEYALTGESGGGMVDLRIRVPVDTGTSGRALQRVPPAPVSVIETSQPGSEVYGQPVTLALGESMSLPGGEWLRFVAADDWARVTVANDWSVPYLYALFVLAVVGLGVAVFVAPRRALVGLVRSDSGHSLNVVTWHARRDPAFAERVDAELADALVRAKGPAGLSFDSGDPE